MAKHVTGADQINRRLQSLARSYGSAAKAALYRRGEAVATDAKEHYTPIDLGPLKNEIRVFPPERQGNQISVTIAAGTGVSAPYALAVHDHPSKHSPPSWRGTTVQFSPTGTGAKYLERPLLAASMTLERDLVADILRSVT